MFTFVTIASSNRGLNLQICCYESQISYLSYSSLISYMSHNGYKSEHLSSVAQRVADVHFCNHCVVKQRIEPTNSQGCINRSSLPAGLGARGVSSEHVENMENAEKMENMEMFSGSPLMCSPVL